MEKTNLRQVVVDADACPKRALQILREFERIYGFVLVTIASTEHSLQGPEHVIVGNEPQATDMAVMNRTRAGDIVVTQDWGLAAMVLGKGVKALSPTGRIYHGETIEFLLEERHLKATVRKAGGRTKGPRARTAEDDERFTRALRNLLQD